MEFNLILLVVGAVILLVYLKRRRNRVGREG